MIPTHELLLFAFAALGMVLTPGPNMLYLLSRSICQGRAAGALSLVGIIGGFLFHILAAASGLSALFLAVPVAYVVLKYLGAAYLFWLAWNAVKPGARSPFETTALPVDSPRRLLTMGFLTNVLNPKMAVFYLSIFPQFVDPARGSVFVQSVTLGLTQVSISFAVNGLLVLSAAQVAAWFGQRPGWVRAQRWLMGGILGALGLRLALERRR